MGLSSKTIVRKLFAFIGEKTKTEKIEAWNISPYPDGKNFAFTFVHDPDHAFSKRLAPIIDVFDELNMKISLGVYVRPGDEEMEARDKEYFKSFNPENAKFWSPLRKKILGEQNKEYFKSFDPEEREFWGPITVNLTNADELQFYKKLSKKGYEIGLHTPGPRSDTRDEIIQAFEFINKNFGFYPKLYVEHYPGGNKECQSIEGHIPNSPYYSVDVLNFYNCWVWVSGQEGLANPTHKKFYDILAACKTPIDVWAQKHYGVIKAFHRSGKWGQGDGDGFLSWYTEENILSLEKERGLALVYTHLANNWLDPKTRQMREDIRKRLKYLSLRNGWFVGAAQILDRFEAMNSIYMSYDDRWIKIINKNSFPIEGLTLIGRDKINLKQLDGEVLKPNEENEIIIKTIHAMQTLSFEIVQ